MTKDEEDQAIQAVAVLGRGASTCLGPAFEKAWPVDIADDFSALLAAIDDAELNLPGREG